MAFFNTLLRIRAALGLQRLQSLAHVTQPKAKKLQRERGIETRARESQPVVECVLGPAHGARAAVREAARDLERRRVHLLILDAARHQANTLGLLARERLVEQQVVARLRKPAQ